MKRIKKFAAVNVIAALLVTGIPALAAEEGHEGYNRGGEQHQSVNQRNGPDRGRLDYDRRDGRGGYQDDRGYGYAYAPGPVYEPAPVYGGPVYDGSYYYGRSHDGRTAAIIGGSAATGALIGAAAGHAQGAVLGAVIGGIAGAAVNAATDHHHR